MLRFVTVEGRRQKRKRRSGRQQQGKQDIQPGLPADGADLAPRPQQDGVHTHRLRRPPRHHVQCAPPRVHLQPRPGEHAPRRQLPAVRQGRLLVVATAVYSLSGDPFSVSTFAPHHSCFSGVVLYCLVVS